MTGLPPVWTLTFSATVAQAVRVARRRRAIASRSSAMPAFGQYVVLPSCMARVVASAMFAGVARLRSPRWNG